MTDNEPGPANDYGRDHIGGMQGPIQWESLLAGDGLEGWEVGDAPYSPTAWSREGDTVIADVADAEQARLLTGDSTWLHYEFKVQATIIIGSNLQIQFRISEDGEDFYFLDCLMGWKATAISKMTAGEGNQGPHPFKTTKLDVNNFFIKGGQEYDIVIAVRGNSLTSYIDGKLINRVTDATNPMGGVAFGVCGERATARFRDPKVRHYFREKPA